MAKAGENATEVNNFHVRLKPGMARWLRRKVNADAPSVPEVIRTVLTKEQILEKERRRARRARPKRKP